MSQTNTLAPCPFCGERAETDFIPEHHSYQIECSDSMGCTARVTRDSELGAIEAWNRRVSAPASQPVAVPAGMEPVAWIDMEEWPPIRWREGMVRADVREIDGMALYTAAQVQAMLTAAPSGPAREPLSPDRVKEILSEALYDVASATRRADFINGLRHGEIEHGITAAQKRAGHG